MSVYLTGHDEVTSGHLINTGEATTLTDGPAFINQSDLLKSLIAVARVAAVALLAPLLVAACRA